MERERMQESKMPDGRPLEQQPKWRHDFPVDIAREEDVERRDFVKFMVLVSAAFAAGQFWVVGKDIVRRRSPAPGIMPIARVDEVKVGDAISFHYPGEHDPCVLVRTDEQTYVAYNQLCTHLSCAVLPRMEERSLHCPCHEGSFDMMTGLPTGGPPRRPLPKITLEIRENTIYATGVELRT
jgi:Rieske Fe-S protein